MSKESSLSEIAAAMGFRRVPEVLAAAETPIGRGHHLALAAGRGSGVESVYALAIEEACDPEAGLQALVLVPTRDRAAEVALAVQRYVGSRGLKAGVAKLRPDGSLDVGTATVQCLVARPSLLLPEIRLGRLGLGGLQLLVLDGVADLEDLDEWTSVEPILDTLDTDIRRIAVTRRVDDDFGALVQRQLPRGRRWPESAFEEAEAPNPVEKGYPECLDVGLGATAEERLSLLVGAVAGRGNIRVRCRSEDSRRDVAAALESAGYTLAEPGDGWDVIAALPEADDAAGACRAWFGLPLSIESLAVGPGDQAVAIVDGSHRAQLEILATRVGTTLRFLPGSLPATELNPLGRYRSLVRARVERGGTDAELLVLQPLVHEFGTARVAAALSDLLRRSEATDGLVRPWADVEAASRGGDRHRSSRAPDERSGGASSGSGSAHRGARGAWSRVFIGAGNRDSVRVGDLVGAITGETGIAGGQIGKIEIRGSFSLVEIDSQVVDQVIDRLNGTPIRGREVTVKHDRGR
ncbi:MAG: DbpA RNA binding domain-containing protein [Gemmatimonadetes bacterium]|nr:DbpA RNA binding domain-containing protein [Gemmatimonadota bacterium]